MLQRLFTAYAAGSIAALVASCALWVAGRAELIAALDVSIAPSLTWPWIARRLIWGGLWALPYPLLLLGRMSPTRRGVLLSLAPSAAQLFYFFPEAHLGTLGSKLGTLTPLVVVLFNALWGWSLGRVVQFVEGRPG